MEAAAQAQGPGLTGYISDMVIVSRYIAAIRIVEKLGLDMARLKKDAASAEVKKEIEDVRTLAEKMGIRGTPYFLVGDRAVPGALENLLEVLTKHVEDVRKSGCPVC